MGWATVKTGAVEVHQSTARGVDLGEGLLARVKTTTYAGVTQAAAELLLDDWKIATEGDVRISSIVYLGKEIAKMTGFSNISETIPAGARFTIGNDPTIYRLTAAASTGATAASVGLSFAPPSRSVSRAGTPVQFISWFGNQSGIASRRIDPSGQYEVTATYAEAP